MTTEVKKFPTGALTMGGLHDLIGKAKSRPVIFYVILKDIKNNSGILKRMMNERSHIERNTVYYKMLDGRDKNVSIENAWFFDNYFYAFACKCRAGGSLDLWKDS